MLLDETLQSSFISVDRMSAAIWESWTEAKKKKKKAKFIFFGKEMSSLVELIQDGTL